MNTVLFQPHELDRERILSLGDLGEDKRAEHILKVLKSSVGSTLKVGEVGGKLGHGVVLESISDRERASVKIRILDLQLAPPPKLPLHLILALPRPKSLRRVLRGLANIGVSSVDIIQTYRVDKSYWSAPVLKSNNLEAALLEGLSIANDTVVPEVRTYRRLKPYVEDVAAKMDSHNSAKLIAHPNMNLEAKTHQVMTNSKRKILAVGPEGGWTPYEVELFLGAGFQPFSFGDRILSLEMALPVLGTALFFDLHRSI